MPFRVKAEVTVQLRTPLVIAMGTRALHHTAKKFADEIKQEAQNRVSPGVGPSPHPHNLTHGWPDWVDTGALKESIDTLVYGGEEGVSDILEIAVYSDLWGERPYNIALETGWIAPSGRRYVYPFLVPGADAAASRAHQIIRQNFVISAAEAF